VNSWEDLYTIWPIRGPRDAILGYYVFHITGNRSWALYEMFTEKTKAIEAAKALFETEQKELEKILLG